MMFVNSDFSDLLKLFNDNDVKYLVIGGYAVIQHGEPRFTKDLDSRKFKDRVLALKQRGLESGVEATPTFLINGRPVRPDLGRVLPCGRRRRGGRLDHPGRSAACRCSGRAARPLTARVRCCAEPHQVPRRARVGGPERADALRPGGSGRGSPGGPGLGGSGPGLGPVWARSMCVGRAARPRAVWLCTTSRCSRGELRAIGPVRRGRRRTQGAMGLRFRRRGREACGRRGCRGGRPGRTWCTRSAAARTECRHPAPCALRTARCAGARGH